MRLLHPIFFAPDTATAAGPSVPVEKPPAEGEPPMPQDQPDDWATIVGRHITGEEPVPKQEPAKETKVEPTKEDEKKGIPDQLFQDKKEEPPKSELDAIGKPDFRSETNKNHWDALHEKARGFENKVRELEKELTGARDGSKKAQELEAKIGDYEKRIADATKQAEEYRGIVQKVRIDEDPEFRKTYVDGRSSLIQEARTVAEESGLDPKSIEIALNLKGKPRIEALETAVDGMSNFQQGRLGEIITKLNRLDADADTKRGDPKEYFKAQEQAAKARHEEQERKFSEDSARAYHKAERKLGDELIVLKKLEGDDNKWWNDLGDSIRTKAKADWETNQDPARAAELFIKGHATEVYERAYTDMRGERDALKTKLAEREKELEELYGTGPKPGVSAGAKAAPSGGFRDFADIVAESANLK